MIVVAGEALIDLILAPDGTLAATPGGGPFNTARAIARLGGGVAYLGCLSTDRFGEMLRAALIADGVDLSLTATTEAPTTLAIAELDAAGAATYRFHTAETSAPEISAGDVARAVGAKPAALHLGTLGLVLEPAATALADGVAAVSPKTVVMLDPNCRASMIRDRAGYLARLDRVLARADVVKVSVDDLAYLDPGSSPIDAARTLAKRGPGVVLLTDGGRPVLVITSNVAEEVDVPSVRIVDTVGAGDAFGGAFLARWTERGLGRADLADLAALHDAVTLAVDVATITCQRAGADPPRRSETAWPPR
ncbi:MAG: carbohydrate kinase family protein [Chloroflexota bacterium]